MTSSPTKLPSQPLPPPRPRLILYSPSDEAIYKRRYRALQEIVYEIEDVRPAHPSPCLALAGIHAMAQENNLIALKIAQVRARVRQSQSERERAKHASAESEQRRDSYSPTKALPSHPYLKTQTLAPATDPPSRPPSAHPLSLSPLPHPAPSASHSMARAYADMQASRLGAGVKDEDVQMGDS